MIEGKHVCTEKIRPHSCDGDRCPIQGLSMAPDMTIQPQSKYPFLWILNGVHTHR